MPSDHLDVSDVVRTELAALGEQRSPVEGDVADDGPEHPPCVLVVDNEADMRSFLRSCLEPPWQVKEAADGESALLRVHDTSPVLAIVDVRMPGMDGVAFTQALKAEADTKHIPVLLMSGQPPLEHGADAFLAKPFTRRRLVRLVERLLASGATS